MSTKIVPVIIFEITAEYCGDIFTQYYMRNSRESGIKFNISKHVIFCIDLIIFRNNYKVSFINRVYGVLCLFMSKSFRKIDDYLVNYDCFT